MIRDKKIIGLTGMSGSGKTSAAKIFAEYGFYVIDCDKEARRIISGQLCREVVRQVFPEAYDDRVKMAQLVFSDAEKLNQYEKIVYPYITYGILDLIAQNGGKIILDAPTLFQSGADDLCNKIIAVVADREVCRERIVKRDNLSENDAELRMNSQPGKEYFKKRVDFFIENNTGLNEFTEKIKEIIKDL